MPGQISLAAISRRLFRDTAEPLTLKVGFDALSTLRNHIAVVKGELPKVQKDHAELTKLLTATSPSPTKYWAKQVTVPLHTGLALKAPHPDAEGAPAGDVLMSAMAKASLLRREGFDLKVGHALVAHPLSSAHADRRVMLIVEMDPITTTALVLDMLYSYPLSHGNPMFPEVLWGHEVHNGGYCHVDFTMPPTANVSLLHTLEPPEPAAPNYSRWLQWVTKSASNPPTDPEKIRAQHEACCQPVIRGDPATGTPTLYYSKVEALPYLATLAQGQPRDSLRVYWGCMKWSTSQLISEVALGHWMPTEISPNFFGAYGAGAAASPAGASGAGPVVAVEEKKECFPTEEQLRERRTERERHFGADVSPPQLFPPTQPICRREALWDQIMHALGGPFSCLVGCTNPFASPRGEYSRVPPVDGITQLHAAEPQHDGSSEEFDLEHHDDDDDDDSTEPPSTK